MTINWNEPIESVDGTPVHYVGIDSFNFAVVQTEFGFCRYYRDGAQLAHSQPRIRNTQPKPKVETFWGNYYGYCQIWAAVPALHPSKELADAQGCSKRKSLLEFIEIDNELSEIKIHKVST